MNTAHLLRAALVASIIPVTVFAVAQPLSGTRHADGRDAPKLVISPPSENGQRLSPRDTADAFLKAHSGEFNLAQDLSNLVMIRAVDSLIGTHFHYQQQIDGIPVENAEIIVSVNRNSGEVYQAYNNIYPVAVLPQAKKAAIDSETALDAAWQHLKVHGKLRGRPRVDLMYMPVAGGFRLVYKTSLFVDGPDGEWEHKIDALSGEVLAVRSTVIDGKDRSTVPDFAAYKGAVLSRKDATAAFIVATTAKTGITATVTTNGTALVFDPDPRTTLKNAALLDSDAASVFASAYVTRPLREISYNAGVFSLTGPWVTIQELETPSNAPSTTATGNWTALRGVNAFNDVMTYYFIDTNQRYLRALGFTNVQAAPIQADSDGLDGADNSHYMSGAANYLAFGHGGVDDNEDADVILHEYGHAITYSIVPSWGGGDTRAIGEGFGDYWGGSYSYGTSNGPSFHPEWAFSWDGHGSDTWSGRLMNMTNLTYDPNYTYIDHETIGGVANYSDQLWSAPLFQSMVMLVAGGYARTNVDKIVIESMYGISGNPSMRDMAYATVSAASNLFPSAPYARVFYDNFVQQRILPVTPPKLQYPSGGEIFMTGSVVHVRWDKRFNEANTNAVGKASVEMAFLSGTTSTPSYIDTMEGGVGGWTTSKTGVATGWALMVTNSHSATHSWFAPDPTTTADQFLVSPSIAISNGYELSFWHQYDLESTFDGGVVEAKTNGGIVWVDIGSNSTQNGYNSTISSSYGNSIGGRRAFSGTTNSYIQTLIPLTAFTGKTVNLRFRLSSDSSDARTGWLIDDVSIGVAQGWAALSTSPSNTVRYTWTLPLTASTNYQLHIRHAGPVAWESSGWVESQPFIVSVDSDTDGIPDQWETRYFGNLSTANSTSDYDHDGITDRNEYYAGTVPSLSNSMFAVSAVSNRVGNSLVLQWRSVTNREYSVYLSTNLITGFSLLSSNLPATPDINQFTDTNSTPVRFYQIRTQF